ncbi:DUF2283 domain-containing protein [Baaleninema simplex]|uniref:DUF2283 domain-containing protein n=1 Tax=Baaleninema simplex TaxID=2862350 RepID=UPI0003460AA1|nr:DUF2283 domain-containing protein [Baaleninema simplex]
MTILHDSGIDTIAPIFSQDAIETSEEAAPGIIIDYTEQGQIVAIESLDASERLPLPLLLESIGVRSCFVRLWGGVAVLRSRGRSDSLVFLVKLTVDAM